jgi:hypothetical protein
MEIGTHLLLFHNYSDSKFPSNISARYCFYDEFVELPNTDIKMEVLKGCWLVYDNDSDLLLMLSMDEFNKLYDPTDTKAVKYYEFVQDSFNVDYSPDYNALDDALLESINDLREKEISLSFMGKIRLIFDLIVGKKIFISKY